MSRKIIERLATVAAKELGGGPDTPFIYKSAEQVVEATNMSIA